MLRIATIDAHTAGEPLRLIVGGFPAVEGATILEQREFVREHHDHLRRALMLEPRGHADMYGALLTPPEHPGSHAGVLFMHNEGFSTMCGHGIIAVTTIAIERNLITAAAASRMARCGSRSMPLPGRSSAVGDGPTGSRVSTSVALPQRPLVRAARGSAGARRHARGRADVAFGGAFYAIVDSEAVGIPIVPERLPDLRRVGMEIKHAVEAAVKVVHPLEPQLHGIYGTIFTGPPSDERADLRNVTIFADAEVDRSPCGTGTAAVMAVLAAMGMLVEGGAGLHPREHHRHEVPRPRRRAHDGRRARRDRAGDRGEAYITGENTFLIDERDPLRHGFRIIAAAASPSPRLAERSSFRRVARSSDVLLGSALRRELAIVFGRLRRAVCGDRLVVQHLPPDREPVLPRIRAAHHHAGLRVDQDPLEAAERADAA